MKSKKLYTILLLINLSTAIFAQRQTSSPFSRYGYGDLFPNTSTYHQGMGNVSVGIHNPTQINFANPAQQASIKKETFLFNIGVGCAVRQLKENNSQAPTTRVGLDNFSLAFPVIAERWGCAIGLLPFNSVGYSMNYGDSLANYSYRGNGGINRVALSTGIRLFKGLSVGANFSYLFGTTNYTAENSFEELSAYYTRKDLEYKTYGFLWNVGIQYNWQFQETKMLSIGATFRNAQSALYTGTEFFGSYFPSENAEFQKDTANYKRIYESKTEIPTEWAFGLSFKDEGHYLFGIDAGVQNWDGISIYGKTDSNLKSTKFVRLGGEYVVDYRSPKFFKRLPIRAGVHFANLPIVFNHNDKTAQANEMGISLGTQIRSKQTQNSLALAVDFGVRGNQNSLAKSLQETYLLTKINITLQEVWFTKRKIN